jgi:branched-subunit amino acid ABC-type transport system permease component
MEATQLLLNGIIAGAVYGLLGVSFGLIFSVTDRFHFAYSLTYMLAAVAAVTGVENGLPLLPAALVGLLVVAVVGMLIELVVYRPVAAHGGWSAPLSVAIASLGITIAGQNLVQLLWGSETARALNGFDVSVVRFGDDLVTTSLDLLTLGVCAALIVAMALTMRYTGLGRRIEAVRAEPEMARVVGLRPKRVGLIVFAIGSALAGVLGVLAAMRTAATPEMGFDPMFYAFVVAFVAGAGRPPLVIAGVGVLIGIAESMSALAIPTIWATTVVFGILFLYLVGIALRTRGVVAQR